MTTIPIDKDNKIEWFAKKPEAFLDKSVFIIGKTGSGKTQILLEMMYLCKDMVPNVLVICPDSTTKFYKGIVPDSCIINADNVTKEKFVQIWERQKEVTEIYNAVNDIDNLVRISKKFLDKSLEGNIMSLDFLERVKIDEIKKDTTYREDDKQNMYNEIREITKRTKRDAYKKSIYKHKSSIYPTLEDGDRIIVDHLFINPRMLIVMDDCSEYIKGWNAFFKKDPHNIFESIAFRGRHYYITFLQVAHDDTLIDPKKRKNAQITIYTSGAHLLAAVDRGGYDKSTKKLAAKVAGKVFDDENREKQSHKKVVFLSDQSNPFQYTVANVYGKFTVSNSALDWLDKKINEYKKKKLMDKNKELYQKLYRIKK